MKWSFSRLHSFYVVGVMGLTPCDAIRPEKLWLQLETWTLLCPLDSHKVSLGVTAWRASTQVVFMHVFLLYFPDLLLSSGSQIVAAGVENNSLLFFE